MLNKEKVRIEIWRGIASPVSAPHGTVLEIRDLDAKEERLYRMNHGTWALLSVKQLEEVS